MRQLVFLLIMLSCFAVNAQRKPSFISTYIHYQVPVPSTYLSMQRNFTYDEKNNLVQEVIEDFMEYETTLIKRVYDSSNRLVFLAAFDENEDTIRKEICTYYAENKVIEYLRYENQNGVMSPVEKTIFAGVNDMNEPEGKIGMELFGFNLEMKYRNCTSVTTEFFVQDAWTPIFTITPEYNNGRVYSLSIPNFDISAIFNISDIPPLTVAVNFTYNVHNRLSKINFNLTISLLPIPITIATIENAYENNLLADSVISSSGLSMFGLPDFTTWYQFTYNEDKSIAMIRQNVFDATQQRWNLTRTDCYDCLLNTPVYVKNELKLFPNPVQNNLRITTENDPISTVTVYDLIGKEVMSLSNIDNCNADINVQNLNSGCYILRIKTVGDIVTKRFIKQ